MNHLCMAGSCVYGSAAIRNKIILHHGFALLLLKRIVRTGPDIPRATLAPYPKNRKSTPDRPAELVL
ncbi:hypothetical protein TRIP_B250391 [uncultured Desulfatiglans sp.]|uniref:Uncharacterized protein n=1 Tax=Uncultured Desulfatiglans sp. TaxID=1748965 RepID=A0A653A5U8_UNCDX|nr:hypothetical protein TRIP_B250391 [uncultured Desulfatiglans sp.]